MGRSASRRFPFACYRSLFTATGTIEHADSGHRPSRGWYRSRRMFAKLSAAPAGESDLFKYHKFTGVGPRRAGVLLPSAAPIPVLMFALALTLASVPALAATPGLAATPAPGNLDAAR